LTLPLFTDTEITCTGVDMKFRDKLSERGSKPSPLRKVDVGLRGYLNYIALCNVFTSTRKALDF